MKYWLLRRYETLPASTRRLYRNHVKGFLIRAETAERARHIANQNGGEEIWDTNTNVGAPRTRITPWSEFRFCSCIQLGSADGPEELILREEYPNG